MVYEENLSVNDYVKKSGGYKETADRRHMFIVSADGTASPAHGRREARFHWSRGWRHGGTRSRIQNGDVIFVPPRIRIVSGYDITKDSIELLFKLALTAGVVAGL